MFSKNRRSGYTMFELIVAMFILALMSAILVSTLVIPYLLLSDPDVSERPSAEENATAFFAFYYPTAEDVVIGCEGTDPDGDGYTVCVGDMRIGGEEHRYVARCSGRWQVDVFDPLPKSGCVHP